MSYDTINMSSLAVPCSYWMPDSRGKIGVESCSNRCCSLGNLTEKSSYICLQIAKMQVKLKNIIRICHGQSHIFRHHAYFQIQYKMKNIYIFASNCHIDCLFKLPLFKHPSYLGWKFHIWQAYPGATFLSDEVRLWCWNF